MTEAYELWALHEHLERFRRVHLNFQAHRPPLHRGTWQEVDSALDAAIAAAPLDVAVVLTPKDAEALGSSVYVFFEPLAKIVIALGYEEARASISADGDLWRDRGGEFTAACAALEDLLRAGQIVEALLHVAGLLPTLAHGPASTRSLRSRVTQAPLGPGDRVGPYVLRARIDRASGRSYETVEADGDGGPVVLDVFALSTERNHRLRFEREMALVASALHAPPHRSLRAVLATGVDERPRRAHAEVEGSESSESSESWGASESRGASESSGWSGWIASAPDDGAPLPTWRAGVGWAEVLRVVCEVGEALTSVEAIGLRTDAVFADHITVDPSGRVRVALAEALAEALAGAFHSPTTVMGHRALLHVTPEEVLGAPVTARTTQYVLSRIAWEMLHGASLYTYASGGELLLAVANGAITAPPADTAVPAAVRRVLLRGLAVEPRDRWPSLTAWVAALRRARSPLRRWFVR